MATDSEARRAEEAGHIERAGELYALAVTRMMAMLQSTLPAVGQEVRRAQEMGGDIDVVVVVVGLNDIKKAYQSPTGASHTQRRPQRAARAAHGAT